MAGHGHALPGWKGESSKRGVSAEAKMGPGAVRNNALWGARRRKSKWYLNDFGSPEFFWVGSREIAPRIE